VQVKYFDGSGDGRFVGIEKQINEFLKNNQHIKVIDIKFSVSCANEDFIIAALVMYEGEVIG
jgi:hypothetical protein